MRYFYAAVFTGAALLLLGYATACFQEGKFYVRGGAFSRNKNTAAFWIFIILFGVLGIATLVASVSLALGKINLT
jgi:hypothetical protein